MYAETLTVVISATSLMLAFAAGLGWLIKRTDAQFERQSERFAGAASF